MSAHDSPFHRGEKAIQTRLGVADRVEQLGRRMIKPRMAEPQQAFFGRLPTLLLGTADPSGRPWASVLVGEPGFLQPIDNTLLRVAARPSYGDPLQAALVEGTRVGTLGRDASPRQSVAQAWRFVFNCGYVEDVCRPADRDRGLCGCLHLHSRSLSSWFFGRRHDRVERLRGHGR